MSRRRNRTELQRRRRRDLGLLVGFVLVVGLGTLLGWRWLTDPARMPVRAILVEGDLHHLDRAALMETLKRAVDGGFFGTDLRKVRDAALSLPWVASARITRIWPNRLKVEVTEQKAVARWNGRALVNPRGQVFRPRRLPDPPPKVNLHGPEGSAPVVLAAWARWQGRFAGKGLQLEELRLDRRGSWKLKLADGPWIVLGRDHQDQRLERLLGVWSVLSEDQQNLRRVDLRYEQGFAVRHARERS